MQDSTIAAMENLFLALSDRTRLRLLSLMINGEVSVGFLADALGASQPKISRHLAYLRSAGLVSTRRDGKWIYYTIAAQPDPAVGRVLQTTLRSMSDEDAGSPDLIYTSVEPYIIEWRPAEIDVFLL